MFIKTKGYFENKINNIEIAIKSTKKAVATLTEERQILAQKSYLASCVQSLILAKKEYEDFLND